MSVRADFYVGRGKNAEWLGSIAHDGNPTSLRSSRRGTAALGATCEEDYRSAIRKLIASREDGTAPAQGWPWPWNDSRTTDWAYAWDAGVWFSHHGHAWRDARGPECQAPWEDCSHYAWAHFPDAHETRYTTRQWLGLDPPSLGDATAIIVQGIRHDLGGSGSRGSRTNPRDYSAKTAYWWCSLKGGRPDQCVARIMKNGHHLLPNVELVFPPTATRGELVSEPGILIADLRPRTRRVPFPDMKAESNFTTGPRSGIIVVIPKGLTPGK